MQLVKPSGGAWLAEGKLTMRRIVIGFVLVAVSAWFVFPPANATAAKRHRACPKQTSKNALGQRWTWRVVLRGRVSCRQAIRTHRRYIRAVREGRCPTRICLDVTLPGGWTCNSLNAVEEQELGNGLVGGCERKKASFKIFEVKGR